MTMDEELEGEKALSYEFIIQHTVVYNILSMLAKRLHVLKHNSYGTNWGE